MIKFLDEESETKLALDKVQTLKELAVEEAGLKVTDKGDIQSEIEGPVDSPLSPGQCQSAEQKVREYLEQTGQVRV